MDSNFLTPSTYLLTLSACKQFSDRQPIELVLPFKDWTAIYRLWDQLSRLLQEGKPAVVEYEGWRFERVQSSVPQTLRDRVLSVSHLIIEGTSSAHFCQLELKSGVTSGLYAVSLKPEFDFTSIRSFLSAQIRTEKLSYALFSPISFLSRSFELINPSQQKPIFWLEEEESALLVGGGVENAIQSLYGISVPSYCGTTYWYSSEREVSHLSRFLNQLSYPIYRLSLWDVESFFQSQLLFQPISQVCLNVRSC